MILISLCLFFATSLYAFDDTNKAELLLKITKDQIALAALTESKTSATEEYWAAFVDFQQPAKDNYLQDLCRFALSNKNQFHLIKPFIAASVQRGAYMETRIKEPAKGMPGNFRFDETRFVELIKDNDLELHDLIIKKWNLEEKLK